MPEVSLLPHRNGNLSDNYDGLDYIAARMTCQSGRTHEKESGDMAPLERIRLPEQPARDSRTSSRSRSS